MNRDIKSIVKTVGDLPAMPVVAVKVMELLQDPNTSAEVLANAVSLDPAVSARILKVANSSFYGLQRQVSTIKAAIVILGQKTLRSMVLAVSLSGMNRRFGLLEKILWEDSIGCAICSRLLSDRLRSADPEEAFLAGLFRHIGKVVRNNNDPQAFSDLVQAVYNDEGTFSELEKQRFDYDHAVVGAAVLEKWNFSNPLIESTLHHSDLDFSAADVPAIYRLAATVNLAGCFCQKLGIGQRNPDEDLDLSETKGARALDVPNDRLEILLNE
ncbi:MAG TPA: HDOD domain-containing protein, partial [Desulfuromonadales bacterium]|nr:HDOD domain-containing protein [Desulfuromonadales bacterium]